MAKNVLHIIGQAHLDPVWMWPWRDGAAEALTTMQSAVDRMRETPDFCFSHSAAATYRWAQEQDPRLFEEIRQRVREGRWEVVNGWIVEPDCNIPSTESFVRQCLYGKRYFAGQLGVDVTVGYNVDSFGHGAGLPQVLARAGYRYYVMMRPQAHEAELPVLFWWESADGSRVLTWRAPMHYGQSPKASADDLEAQLRAAGGQCFPPGFEHGAFFLGVGNHGGGPTRAHLERIVALQGDTQLPELRFSTLSDFFAAIERSPAFREIPVVHGELQHHARGCYSAMGAIKSINRRAERSLVKAETLSMLAAGIELGPPYPHEMLREAWWKLLFNQFHDVLAGSSLRSCYQDARDAIGAACDAADGVALRSLHALARSVDTSGAPGSVLFVMNHLPWARAAPVQLDTFTSPQGKRITHLRAADDTVVPVQWTEAESGPQRSWRRLTTVVDLPPCGYRAYHLASGDFAAQDGLRPARCGIDGDQLGITSLLADGGMELLSAPAGFVIVEDASDTWAHGIDSFRGELGRPTIESTEVIEDGPVVRIVRQKGRWRDSLIVLDAVTWRTSNAVELRLLANWQERRQILKLEVPTALRAARTFAKTPGGVTEREPDGGEEPCQDWVAVEGQREGAVYTLGVVNDATYSYDCLGGVLRMTCIRSAPFAEHDPMKLAADFAGPYLDQGWQARRFWLIAGRGSAATLNLPRRAEELQSPAEYVMDSAHTGSLPWEQSFLSIAPEQIAVLSAKRSEDANEIVLRVQETQGRGDTVRVVMPHVGVDWSAPIGAMEIRTFAVAETGGRFEVRGLDLLERPSAGGA